MYYCNIRIQKLKVTRLFALGFIFLLFNCSEKREATLFSRVSSSQSGISFSNTIAESDSLNILNAANIYNGGGVAVGDFNNDGLTDVYFSGNMVSNKLYLNKGELRFEDITETAGVSGDEKWCMGVATVDINNDGWLDLYVSASFYDEASRRENLLYVNQGVDHQGIPVFKEFAEKYGLNDNGYSTQSVFLDYDLDGDLDLYLVTNTLDDPKATIRFRKKLTDGTALNTDRLYRNNGNETFTDVSNEAGILIEGWGHAASIADINKDGWPDIYVSNDFVANDVFYINNQNGTFTNQIEHYFKHTPWYAMGTDIVDVNNDGLLDLISLEMLPERNDRKKTMLRGNEYYNYFNSAKFGYQHQYIRNVFQLNQGSSPEGHPVFSDIAFSAGIYQTDWSWNPLIADFDNDGLRDLIITNGLPRDVTDLDYIVYNNGQGYTGSDKKATLGLVDSLPVVKIKNYAFKNNRGVSFSDSTMAWGLGEESYSNGGAYADFDNDGDLDLVINNINETPFLYENTLRNKDRKPGCNFLTINLRGPENNPSGIGTSIKVYYGSTMQSYYEHYPVRGYLSTVDSKVHFGIGTTSAIDSIEVIWPDKKIQLLKNVKSNSFLDINYKDANKTLLPEQQKGNKSIFYQANNLLEIHYKHHERDAIDYNIQAVLPHKLSQYGPGIAVGDIDNNGYDDFYIGGAADRKGMFFMQSPEAKFTMDSARIIDENSSYEDMGVLFFDADQDGDLDLYKVSGSFELPPNGDQALDNFYLNDGKGYFTASYLLPLLNKNGSVVRAADFDGDGDLDLFIGGRSVSGAYPTPPESYILKNHQGTFIDVTASYCPALKNVGMVTDALWSDFDHDGKVDLIVVGEWMPISFFKNVTDKFASITNDSGIGNQVGWWNSLSSGDFDEDGDMDYVAGNLGLNSNYHGSEKAPMTILSKDLDRNGRNDFMIFTYQKGKDGALRPYPVHTRDDLVSQSLEIRRAYPTYKSFGEVNLATLWPESRKSGALIMEANNLASSYIENLGKGKFSMKELPFEAQQAPVFGILSKDINNDSNLDLIMIGNDFGMDPLSGRHDAFNGLCLLGNGKGSFKSLSIEESGFYVKGDGKGLATLRNIDGREYVITTQNQDSLLVFGSNPVQNQDLNKSIRLNQNDFSAEFFYKDGTKSIEEFYYGSTFLSQSSRIIEVNKNIEKIIISEYSGNQREMNYP